MASERCDSVKYLIKGINLNDVEPLLYGTCNNVHKFHNSLLNKFVNGS